MSTWTCKSCTANTPDEKTVCWNCLIPRDASGAVNSTDSLTEKTSAARKQSFFGVPDGQSFFVALFNGEISLPMTFWYYCVFCGLFFNFMLKMVVEELQSPWFFIASSIVLQGWFIVVWVGIWRASSRYEGPVAWSYLSKIVVCASALRTLFLIFGR